jgi:hypothetical protein
MSLERRLQKLESRFGSSSGVCHCARGIFVIEPSDDPADDTPRQDEWAECPRCHKPYQSLRVIRPPEEMEGNERKWQD